VHNSGPAVHAVAKAAVPVAPVIAKAPVYAGHGHGHGYATPVVKAVGPAYAHAHGGYDGYDGGHFGGHGHYAAAPYYGQIQRVSHASGVDHYGTALAAAAPVYAGYPGAGYAAGGHHHHQPNYDY